MNETKTLYSFLSRSFLTKGSNALYLEWKLLQYNSMFEGIVHFSSTVDSGAELNMFVPYMA